MIKNALFYGALSLLAAGPASAISHVEVFKTNKYDTTSFNIGKCITNKCVIEVTVNMNEKPCAKTNDNGLTVLWLKDLKPDQYPVIVYWEVKTSGWSFQTNGVKFKKGHPFTNPQKLSNPEGYSVELKAKPNNKDLYDYGLSLVSAKEKCEFDPGLVTDW